MNTLQELRQTRKESRQERFENAKRFTDEYAFTVEAVRRNAPLNSLPKRIREWLEQCSEAMFTSFESAVHGKRRSDSPNRKAS